MGYQNLKSVMAQQQRCKTHEQLSEASMLLLHFPPASDKETWRALQQKGSFSVSWQKTTGRWRYSYSLRSLDLQLSPLKMQIKTRKFSVTLCIAQLCKSYFFEMLSEMGHQNI